MAEDDNENGLGNDRPFASCKPQVDEFLSNLGKSMSSDIITSRDEDIAAAMSDMLCDTVPEGFKRWRLPFYFESEGVNFYISTSVPDVEVPAHSHKHGPVVRFILEGSLWFNGVEFTTADWMFIPEGVEYGFTVGPRGLVTINGYQCCCG